MLDHQQREIKILRDALINDMRWCDRCDLPMFPCTSHRRRLDALYPEKCDDPECYACRPVADA